MTFFPKTIVAEKQEPTRESFKKHLCFVYDGSVEIRVSELPDNDAAILGAAALTKA